MKSKPKLFVKQVSKIISLKKSDTRTGRSQADNNSDNFDQTSSNLRSAQRNGTLQPTMDVKISHKRKSIVALSGATWRRPRELDSKARSQRKINAELLKAVAEEEVQGPKVRICCSCFEKAQSIKGEEVILECFEELKKHLISQTDMICQKINGQAFKNWKTFEEVVDGVRRSKVIFESLSSFLSNLLSTSATQMKEMLAKCTSDIQRQIQSEFQLISEQDVEKLENQLLKSMIRATMAQESKIDLVIQVRHLETLLADIELSTNKMAVYLGQTGAEARTIEQLLRKSNEAGLVGQSRQEQTYSINDVSYLHEEKMDLNIGIYLDDERNIEEEDEEEDESNRVDEKLKDTTDTKAVRGKINVDEEVAAKSARKSFCSWESIAYAADEDNNVSGSEITCLLKFMASSTVLKADNVIVKAVDVREYNLEYKEHEELISNVLFVKPAEGKSKLELPVSTTAATRIFVPHGVVSRFRECSIKVARKIQVDSSGKSKKVAEKNDDSKDVDVGDDDDDDDDNGDHGITAGTWRELETSTINSADIGVDESGDWFVSHAALKSIPRHGLLLAVVSRPKHDRGIFGQKGGKLSHGVDGRIVVIVPKNSFQEKTEVLMQAIWNNNSSNVPTVKEEHPEFVGVTPLIKVRTRRMPSKNLVVKVIQPPASNKKKKDKKDNFFPSFLPTIDANSPSLFSTADDNIGDTKPVGTDVLVLVAKENGKWKVKPEIEFVSQNDIIAFVLKQPLDRFAFLRLSEQVEPQTISSMMTKFEGLTFTKEVLVASSQKHLEDGKVSLVVRCLKCEQQEKVLQHFEEIGYNSEGAISERIRLREGASIILSFKGNIDFTDRTPRKILFHSNLKTNTFFADISEINPFGQNALPMYRGTLQIKLLEENLLPRVKNPQAKSSSTNDLWSRNSIKLDASPIENALSEVQIFLPKKEVQTPSVKRIQIVIKNEGPLSDAYFDRLSSSLGGSWKSLADKLSISRVSVQRIISSCSRLDQEVLRENMAAKQMLFQWFKTSPKSCDKVTILKTALKAIGRLDLVDELTNPNHEQHC